MVEAVRQQAVASMMNPLQWQQQKPRLSTAKHSITRLSTANSWKSRRKIWREELIMWCLDLLLNSQAAATKKSRWFWRKSRRRNQFISLDSALPVQRWAGLMCGCKFVPRPEWDCEDSRRFLKYPENFHRYGLVWLPWHHHGGSIIHPSNVGVWNRRHSVYIWTSAGYLAYKKQIASSLQRTELLSNWNRRTMRIAVIAQLFLCFVVGKDLGKDTNPITVFFVFVITEKIY